MDLFLEPGSSRGATRSLFEQVRDAILSGRITEGDRLPPTRELAGQLGVSRHTVTTVYGRLAAEGFIEGRSGGGSFVSHVARTTGPGTRPAALAPRGPVGLPPGAPDPGLDLPSARFDLRPARPDPALFPLVPWRQCVTSALQSPPPGYGDAAGLPELRRALARWVGRSRSVVAAPDQVLVTAGAQQAIDLVVRLLVLPGDVIAVEEPGYPPVRDVCAAAGASVVPVPVDRQGLIVDAIPAAARMVYVTPSHQSPSGATMSLPRRRALLAFAELHGIAVIEDDYDSEYRHDDRPLEPLYTLDRSGRVIYVGTFSKTLSPSLRVGFAVLPPSLVAAATHLRGLLDVQPPALVQQAMVRFIGDGHLDRHLRRTRRVYRERHALVTRFVHEQAAAGTVREIATNHAGIHVAVELPSTADEIDVRRRALAAGVATGEYGSCWLRTDPPPGLIVGYGVIATADLPEALAALRGALSGTT